MTDKAAIPALIESEEWRDAPGFPGYAVSSLGRVRSLPRFITQQRKHGPVQKPVRERIMRLSVPRNHGYSVITLRHDGAKVTVLIHRLVAKAFLGEPDGPSMECGHLNGCRTDNRVSNLAWVTKAENEAQKEAHGSVLRGERAGSSKLTTADVYAIRARLSAGEPPKEIAASFNLNTEHVRKIGRRVAWAHLPPQENANV